MKGSQKKQGKKGKTKDVGKDKGQRERNKPSKQTTMDRVSTRRKGRKEAKEKDHECSESTVHEFDTRCDRNRPVPPP